MASRTGLRDLFDGFATHRVACKGTDIHFRSGGSGPPLLLIHGYPQSHVMWHKVAPRLAETHTVIVPDLPGYGESAIPPLTEDHVFYSKRHTAGLLVELMASLGHERFSVIGHDRGGRVAYRMALDHPGQVDRVAVLDILPTHDYWERMDRKFALKIYHWAFLAQPAPFPETMIAAAADTFLNHTLASWTAGKTLDCFDADALEHYHAFFAQPERIAATCEDYRAGATIDFEHDRSDLEAGNRIQPPLLAVWGQSGIAPAAETPLDVWSRWARSVTGGPIESGHFVAEENPSELMAMLLPFLEAHHAG